VDVNARDEVGYTALKYASDWGNVEVMKLLRQAGAKE
jgi:ankyrin repeat protein